MDIILISGLLLFGLGIVGAVKGSGVESPVGRFLNLEVTNFGVMLILLSLYEVFALLGFAAATVVMTFIFMRLFLRTSLIEKMKGEKK